MSQLTAEERRRSFEHRLAAGLGSQRPRSIMIEEFAGRQRVWPRTARFGALLPSPSRGRYSWRRRRASSRSKARPR